MKKLLLLALIVLGGVMTANATDYVVAGHSTIVNGNADWANNNTANQMIAVNENQYYLVVENCNLETGTQYEFKVVPNGVWNPAYPGDNYSFQVDKSGTYTLIYTFYYNSDVDYTVNVVPVLNLTLSNNYNGADIWDTYNSAAVFSHESGTYKWTLDLPAASKTGDWYFRIFKDGLLKWNSDDGKNKIRPNSDNQVLTIGGNADANTWIGTETRSWKVAYPEYDYDHFTITAEYNVASRYANNWNVSVDAYISKTVTTSVGYATFGAPAPVDLSNLPYGVTAEWATVTSNGAITYYDATELAEGEGVLLHNTTGSDQTLSIPVKASATVQGTNALRRVTSAELAQTIDDYTNYILTTSTINGEKELGWFKVNDDGCNNLTVGTAYLRVDKTHDARKFFPLWSDNTNSIEAVESMQMEGQAYNLNGQRVAQPTKGLYIVNGKKVILK